jgi:PAS domain S-box-containing protein
LAPSGYARDEFIQLSYWDITPQEYEPSEKKALEQLKTTGSYGPYEKEYIRKDGSRYPVRLQGILMKEVEGRQLIWSLVEDITERVKNERMKNEFVSTVSHELRTPLTSVSGSLSLIASGALGELPPVMREMVAIAQKNSKRLALLINDLLDMDKLLSGNMRFELQQQLLAPLLEQCLQANQSYADQYRIRLSLQVPPNEVIVSVDTQRLEQVMANLLSNAIKFSPAGSQVDVVVVRDSAHVEISVIDCGVGIAEEFHKRIFQKFAQADSSDTRGKGGTGLGLAITKELITRMNGTVGFESTVGEGSRFFIHLPIVERGQ